MVFPVPGYKATYGKSEPKVRTTREQRKQETELLTFWGVVGMGAGIGACVAHPWIGALVGLGVSLASTLKSNPKDE